MRISIRFLGSIWHISCQGLFALGGQVLLGRSLEELQEFAKAHGQPAYRGKQLYDGLMHGAHSVEDITNVSCMQLQICRPLQPP